MTIELRSKGHELLPRKLDARKRIVGLCITCKRETTTCVPGETHYGLTYKCDACVADGESAAP